MAFTLPDEVVPISTQLHARKTRAGERAGGRPEKSRGLSFLPLPPPLTAQYRKQKPTPLCSPSRPDPAPARVARARDFAPQTSRWLTRHSRLQTTHARTSSLTNRHRRHYRCRYGHRYPIPHTATDTVTDTVTDADTDNLIPTPIPIKRIPTLIPTPPKLYRDINRRRC